MCRVIVMDLAAAGGATEVPTEVPTEVSTEVPTTAY